MASTHAAATDRPRPLFDLSGTVALVTGGGRGIGRACSLALARQGAAVVVGYVGHPDEAEATVEAARAMGHDAEVAEGDVADAGAARGLVRRAKETMGRLDVVVNNAGIVASTPFTEITEPEWDRILAVDLKGTFLVAQAAAREMIADGHGGRIINVSSIASGGVGVGFSGISHYTSAKGGVIGLTETMAIELAPHGILVNAIAPGVIETDMTRFLLDDPGTRERTLRHIPLERAGRPEEVGAVAAFLASKEASYVTGSTVYVDGGWLAG